MKDAASYPVGFPYGSTDPPYSPGHAHRGDDRFCPMGTPVIINGVTIGLTGATGKVTGPHLHIQEWRGNVVTGIRKPQNAFVGGTVVNIDQSGTQGDGSFGKFITVQTDDGWNDSYCHLSQINVQIGQVLKKGNDMFPNTGDLTNVYNATGWPGHAPNDNDVAHWTTGTGNADWDKGADAVWKAWIYEVTKYVSEHPVLPADDGSKAKLDKIKEIVG